MKSPPRLIFFCGKMAAGKSTLARELTQRENAILLAEDELLNHLYAGEITDIAGYIGCSSRVKSALTAHVCALLAKGFSVVLDFPANTPRQRAWFRNLIDQSGVQHELHLIDAPDALCKRQLKERSQHLPPGSPWTTEAEFEAVTAYFQPPSEAEGFTIIRHERG
jgi:predicted kinase